MDCHLMIDYPENLIEDFANAGADVIIIHQEAKGNTEKALKLIKKFKKRAGICIKPKTNVSVLTKNVMKNIDYVLIMSVNPGFGGQVFIAGVVPKIEKLREWVDQRGLKTDIEVDGGISGKTIHLVSTAGANVFVAGSAIFKGGDYEGTIREMRDAVQRAG